MQSVWRIIGLTVFLSLLVGGVIAGLVWTQHRAEPVVCRQCTIVIEDEQERQYVSTDELVRLLQAKHLSPEGKNMTELSLQQIEEQMRAHPMVRTAQCVLTPQGTLFITVTQRVPIVHVQTDADRYYVDADRTRMPERETVNTSVMKVTGTLTESDACGPVADMVLWITNSAYWHDKIASVYVSEAKNITLTRHEGTRLLIGTHERYKNKLNKLQAFYQHYPSLTDSVSYRALDARYAGQVVGVK